MSKKSSNDNDIVQTYLIAFCFTIALMVVFSIVAVPYHLYLSHKYLSPPPARRINDFNHFVTAIFKSSILLFFLSMGLFVLLSIFFGTKGEITLRDTIGILMLLSPAIMLWLWAVLIGVGYVTGVHFGVVVDPTKDRVVFRVDQESYDLIDYLKLKFITDLPKFDMVPLSAIYRITRKSGKHLYLVGDFGSRRISFTNKQKRDECIFSITSSGMTSAKVFSEFETT